MNAVAPTTQPDTAKADFKLGRLMRQWREKNGLSQREVAGRLGYRNINFVSMLEHGWSNIPIGKIPAIVKAYDFPPEMNLIILREVSSEVWATLMVLNEKVIKSKAFPGAIERSDEIYKELCSEANVRDLKR